jgi:hypothetical protein
MDSKIDELSRLAALHRSGVLDEEEFLAQKAKLLEEPEHSSSSTSGYESLEFKYKAGWKIRLIGLALVLACLYCSQEMLSSTTEWHLESTELPFIIPNIVIQTLWCLVFALGAGAVIISFLPGSTLLLKDDEVVIPTNPITKTHISIQYADITGIEETRHIIALLRNGPAIGIVKAQMSGKDHRRVKEELLARTGLSL